MTNFFLAGVDADDSSEVAYRELRERSEATIGCPARPRRIFKLSCRIDGHDCVVEVGKPFPYHGGIVSAILDHGREESFVICTHGDAEDQLRVGRPVYSVTEFT